VNTVLAMMEEQMEAEGIEAKTTKLNYSWKEG